MSNYKQGLGILNGRATLKKTMKDQGIESPEVFECWLEEKKTYLHVLVKEPLHKTLEMEYYVGLVNLHTYKYVDITVTSVSRSSYITSN